MARALDMRRSSIQHVVTSLRSTGEVLPADVIEARPHTVVRPECPIQARILRRARRGLVVLSELRLELPEETAEEIAQAVQRLRWAKAIQQARGYWPVSSHHDPKGRQQRLRALH